MLNNNYFTNINIPNVPFDRFLSDVCLVQEAPVSFIKQNIPIHADLVQYEPAFICAIINNVAKACNSGQTPGRILQWNMISLNGGDNRELMDLVILVANHAALGVNKDIYHDIETSAMYSVDFILESRVCYIVASTPDLLKLYPHEAQQKICEVANHYVAAARDVTEFINTVIYKVHGFNRPSSGFGAPAAGFGAAASFGASNSFSEPVERVNTFNTFQKTGVVRPKPRSSGNVFGAPRQNNTNFDDVPFAERQQNVTPNRRPALSNPIVTSSRRVKSTNDGLSGLVDDIRPVKETTSIDKTKFGSLTRPKATANESIITAQTTVIISKENVTWKSNKYQLFNLACPKGYKRATVLKKNSLNEEFTITELVKLTPNEEMEMNRNEHVNSTLRAVERNTPFKMDSAEVVSRQDFLVKSLNNVADTHDTAINVDSETFSSNENDYLLSGYSLLQEQLSSLEEAINMARQVKVLATNVNHLGAHRMDYTHGIPFLMIKDEYSEFKKILASNTLDLIAVRLKAALLDDKWSMAFNTALIQLDSYIKKTFINFLRTELGLVEYVSLDTFVDDYEDIYNDIRETNPARFEIFKKSEKKFIDRYLTVSEVNNLITKVEEKDLIAAYIMRRCSVTVVDFVYDEFEIDLVPNEPNVVTRGAFPKIYDFLDELVNNDYVKPQDMYYATHHLVTSDNEVLTIYLSKTGVDTIVIKKES